MVVERCGIITGSQLLILIGQILLVCLILSLGSLDVLGAFFFFDVELRWVVVVVVEGKFCSGNYSFLS